MSRSPATLLALHALWSGTPAVADLAQVCIGPVLTEDYADALWVGFDGAPADFSEYQAVTQDTEWAGLGARDRTERFDVTCAVTVLTGETTLGPIIARASAIVEAAETALRADPSLGQAPPFVAAIRSQQLFIEPTTSGTQVRIPFTVGVTTRI